MSVLPAHAGGAARAGHAASLAVALERWGTARGWAGTDPYDGLNAAVPRRLLGRWPLALRILTQAVKRSPLDLRPLLGIPAGLSAATVGQLASAYARNGFLDTAAAADRLGWCVEHLELLRSPAFPEPCWGYHFDVQTRVFFYPRTTPNTIATAFAALGLLDAHELAATPGALALAAGTGDFFLRHVPQTPAGDGAYFGYLPGDRTPIHNASMLVCAVLARLARALGREELAEAAAAGLRHLIAHQRPDGSWPYGEEPHLQWVDGFHTGYVLDCVQTCLEAGVGGDDAWDAWRRGLGFYAERLTEPDGTPRYTPDSRYPVDGQCVAQALQTFARAAAHAPALAARRWAVLDYAERALRRPDGAFAFQRERWWLNRAAHPRWVEAPMLCALAHLLAANPD
jgi:hypothetical protein